MSSSSIEVPELIQLISDQLKAFPMLTSFEFEREYNWYPFVSFAKNNYPLAFGLVVGYLLFVVVGTRIMDRLEKPFDLRLTLAAWNALLSIFSFIGMCKTVCIDGCIDVCMVACMYRCMYVWMDG